MDEYIKREDALDAVLFALVGTGYQSQAIYAIRDIPAADVAPKSEVAREIFEEIKNLLLPLVYLGTDGKWHMCKQYASKLHSFVDGFLDLLEKYTEENR